MKTTHTNALIHSSSPYLLQHAHNPVNWFPWSAEILQKAQAEDKPILVSIGYSACHWCHVMERESFENEAIATLMNEYFICIKVDREERPDVDQIYMDAVQAMGLQGGWPLNVFLLPDQRPFYGGTYFPAAAFENILNQVHKAFVEHRTELSESANNFLATLSRSDSEKYNLRPSEHDFHLDELQVAVQKLNLKFDRQWGGQKKAPKFPMPSIWAFLLRYGVMQKDQEALNQVYLTLDRMALGGIYDTLGGGFCRYSVDGEWFAPHFEKMLYDNAQLMSLYAEAYAVSKNPFYQKVVAQTFAWLIREMKAPQGGFYSALDADTEGMEGKFYTWPYEEMEDLLGLKAGNILDYYGCTEEGNWEEGHGRNILYAKESPADYAQRHQLRPENFVQELAEAKHILFQHRQQRVAPGLDNKIITGWNGLLLKGLCDAYAYLQEEAYLQEALHLAEFIDTQLVQEDYLVRIFSQQSPPLRGYLEDYAAVIQGYLALYQVSFDKKWLLKADKLSRYVLAHFPDEKEALFFYTDNQGENLITRKKETFDNVIPASNSLMAGNLLTLGRLLDNREYVQQAENMLRLVRKLWLSDPSYLCQWGILLQTFLSNQAEVAIVGKNYRDKALSLASHFLPHVLKVAGEQADEEIPLMQHREGKGDEALLYVCFHKTCQLPVLQVEEAIQQILGK
ncbi:thioredoxin domain-containing protein [Cytophagales bacterium LB-30]|uniref:Thioredoxin domain-containing protein n=1 Tax=Shiella aurantiaca TaxID=3058365 RepID=A0ABT8F455_9BACT|nr:thioredoxin domain-containing protein [Shiella aurantiaca]MDN4165240.1 thioredoxin domain-containing protein [Shiella aurantiaca]